MLVLLDRDGVINRDAKIGILRVEDFDIFPQALEAIANFTKAGFKIAICTNQSAIGRGDLTLETLTIIHHKLRDEVIKAGGRIDMILHAPDTPEKPTQRRKPGPGMLLEALEAYEAKPEETTMIGDMLRDLEAAHAAGCKKMLVRTGKGKQTEEKGIPDHLQPVTIVDNLLEASRILCA